MPLVNQMVAMPSEELESLMPSQEKRRRTRKVRVSSRAWARPRGVAGAIASG